MPESELIQLARILHESGREAVEKRLIYRDDVPVKPFCEWEDLHEPAKLGRVSMADYLIAHAPEVISLLQKLDDRQTLEQT